MNTQNQSPLSAPASPAKTYLGIDNGLSGAIATLFPDGQWQLWPVACDKSGRDRLLSIPAARGMLAKLAAQADGLSNLVAVCELPPLNPRFGAKSNFTCGRCGEFWRVILTVERIPFSFVSAQTWQKVIFQGVPCSDPKAVAAACMRQRFPGVVEAQSFNKEQLQGVVDAMCIATWARQQNC